MKKIILAITIAFLLHPFILLSQTKTTTCAQYKKLSCPEKAWVVQHVFVAKKAWKITQFVRIQTDSIQKTTKLDKDDNGGQVDAFRHAFWMALLSQKINWRKAYRLGKAHEKGNYLDFKKHRMEEGSLPDKISSDMDLWNNEIGLQIGKTYPCISADSLQSIVIEQILMGKMKIIKKNKVGLFLDAEGNIIENNQIKGKWENTKVLVNSAFQKQKS
ncbi:MAG: DUF6973 domain-containing protein [Bacteroidales bacterium]